MIVFTGKATAATGADCSKVGRRCDARCRSVTFELPFMGWRFTAVRWGLGLVVPFLAGLLAQLIF
jgi:hypothetical protein